MIQRQLQVERFAAAFCVYLTDFLLRGGVVEFHTDFFCCAAVVGFHTDFTDFFAEDFCVGGGGNFTQISQIFIGGFFCCDGG